MYFCGPGKIFSCYNYKEPNLTLLGLFVNPTEGGPTFPPLNKGFHFLHLIHLIDFLKSFQNLSTQNFVSAKVHLYQDFLLNCRNPNVKTKLRKRGKIERREGREREREEREREKEKKTRFKF